MSRECVQCNEKDRINRHELMASMVNIIYESADIILSLNLPRKYTSTHNDESATIYIGVGHNYIKRLLETSEVIETESEVTGKWVEMNGKYEIHLKLSVSTEKNPNAAIRNNIFCKELGAVLESIALAETTLLKLHPQLASTKIFIHFESTDPRYERVEYWHRLGHWAPECLVDPHKETTKRNNKEITRGNKNHDLHKEDDGYYRMPSDGKRKLKRKQHERRPPHMCQACQK